MHNFDYERMRERRTKIVPINELLKIVEPRDDDIILDMGSGDGYFAIKMAIKSPRSKIIAMEISQRGNELLKNEIEKENISNIQIIEADICKTKDFPKFNKAFFSTVFHDFVCKETLLENMKKSLMIGGEFIFFEFLKNSEFGPPIQIKLSQEELKLIAEKQNLTLSFEKTFTEHYVQKYLVP
ncbi:MAG: class I SAM-dependent methyltransferase [Thermoplasmataceae archaeon]